MKKKKAKNRIKSVLVEKGKTSVWLAEELQMSKNTVSKWCTNRMQPTMETLYEIAEVLNVNVHDLLVPTQIK